MCKRILLVDDDKSLLSALSLYLSSHGFSIVVAGSVHSALFLLKQNLPDLIISDILMPKKNGYAFLKVLKATSRYSAIPFIFLSAKGMTPDRILGYNLGCYGYLVKPFDPAELLAIINNVLSDFHNQQDQANFKGDTYLVSDISSNSEIYCDNFTFRERTVLKYVLQGMTNKEIAIELSLSLRNVEKYVSRLLNKTSTRNRTELTQSFYENKLHDFKGE